MLTDTRDPAIRWRAEDVGKGAAAAMSGFEVVFLLGLVGVVVWGSITIANRASAGRAQDFAGSVVDRRHEEVALTTGVRYDFWLMVRTDDDRMITCPVKGSVYESFAIGDRIVKRAGDRWPVKEQYRPQS